MCNGWTLYNNIIAPLVNNILELQLLLHALRLSLEWCYQYAIKWELNVDAQFTYKCSSHFICELMGACENIMENLILKRILSKD